MLTSVTIVCFVSSTLLVNTGELRPLFEAIRKVETGGSGWNPNILGDNGKSLGPYQISRAYWMDTRMRGEWTKCHQGAYAEAVMLAYWRRHCPNALTRRDFEFLARVHNGGPMGQKKRATSPYWQKVRQALAQVNSEVVHQGKCFSQR